MKLHRGMSREAWEAFKAGGCVFQPCDHNQMSIDEETARVYANDYRDEHEDGGVLITFIIPRDAVEEDIIFLGDFRVVKEVMVEVIRKSNVKGINHAAPKGQEENGCQTSQETR